MMKAPKRILVPTDMSMFSLEALDYAQEIARLFDAEIVVLRVQERDKSQAEKGQAAAGAEAEVKNALVRLLIDHDVLRQTIKIQVRHGSPAREIVRAARDLEADLIVMSTHGRTGLSHVLLGSVAEKVVRYSTVPVLTVKPASFLGYADFTEEDVAESLRVSEWPEETRS